MILSHSKEFIFIHNYKVAGTSICDSLKKYDNNSFFKSSFSDKRRILSGVYPKFYSSQFISHISITALKDELPKEMFDNYFKFGFVRNPWDWQVSLYTYALKLKSHHQHNLIKSMKNFDQYIDWRVNENLHLQKEFFYDGNLCLMDYIGKFENLNDDFEKICEKISVNFVLPHANSSRKDRNYLKYYSKNSIEIVNQAFADDINLFGYTKPEL